MKLTVTTQQQQRKPLCLMATEKRKITPKTNMDEFCFVKPMWSLQRDQVVVGVREEGLRQKHFEDKQLILNKCMYIRRA